MFARLEGQLCPALHGRIRKSISDFFVGVMAGSQLVDCESLQTVGYVVGSLLLDLLNGFRALDA